MRVLITGGAGFIGAALAAYLTRIAGYDLVVLDDESLGRREALGDLPLCFIRGDVREPKQITQAMAGCAAVVHLAADTRVMGSISDPQSNFSSNVIGTFNVLEAARSLGIRRVISASTGGAILGDVEPPAHEDMVARPLSPYGASKLAGEGYCSAYAAAYDLPVASLRFSNIYGPGSLHKGSVVAHFFKSILNSQPLIVYGDGNQERDFLFIDDLVVGIARALASDARGVFQLGSGRPTSVSQLISTLREVVGPEYPFSVQYATPRRGELRRTWCKIDRARTAFGFEPETPLVEGLRRTWTWFREATAGDAMARVAT